jgi:hypothetical protein
MRVNMFLMAAMAAAAFLFSGCAASNEYVTGKRLVKNGQVKGLRTHLAGGPSVDKQSYTGYADENNAVYRCSMKVRIYAIAKEALAHGYPYFALKFPEGSNKNPAAVTSVDGVLHYCVPGYYDKETDLLDDKCGHIGLGNGTPNGPVMLDGIFYKKRNPFMPLWDAKKVVQKLKPELRKECWKDMPDAFEKAMSTPYDFGTEDMD